MCVDWHPLKITRRQINMEMNPGCGRSKSNTSTARRIRTCPLMRTWIINISVTTTSSLLDERLIQRARHSLIGTILPSKNASGVFDPSFTISDSHCSDSVTKLDCWLTRLLLSRRPIAPGSLESMFFFISPPKSSILHHGGLSFSQYVCHWGL